MSRPLFDQWLAGFRSYLTHADNTYVPYVALDPEAPAPPVKGAAPASVQTIHNSVAPAAGNSILTGPWAVPNDGHTYWVVALWAQVAPGSTATDAITWQVETAPGGAVLAYLMQAIRQSTTLYTAVSLALAVPLIAGQQLTARYTTAGGIALTGSALIVGY